MTDYGTVGEAMRKAYRLSETKEQRRGVERAAASVAAAFMVQSPGFSHYAFMEFVKGVDG